MGNSFKGPFVHILSLHKIETIKMANAVGETFILILMQATGRPPPLQKLDSCGSFPVAARPPALALGHLAGAAAVLRD